MGIIKVIDGTLYQWETGRAISIKPGPMHTVDEVHYMNPRGDTAYVVEPVTKDGEVIAPIPNILLQEAIDIRAFAVMHTETGDKVVADGTFGVNARQRPSDYVYTEIEFRTYEALADRIEALEKNRMPADTVLFVPQSLNPDQQEQARKNIGAASHDEIPGALPNPEKLTFEGAVSATYDGSSPVVVNIPKGGSGVHVGSEPPADPSVNVWIDPEGGDGDLDLPIPDALPNPHKLTFTGAVTGEYDGSQAVTVALPKTMVVTLTHSNGVYTADTTYDEISEAYEAGQEVRCNYQDMLLPLVQYSSFFVIFACVYGTKLYSVLIKATDNSVTMTVTDASASGSMDLSGYIPAPETAAVGQTVVVKAVDETGKPTQWEATDLPSDCGKWQLLKSVDITEEVRVLEFSEPDWCYDEIYIMLKTIPPIESTGKQVVIVRIRDPGDTLQYDLEEALWDDGSTQIESFVYCFKPYEAELSAGYGVRKGKSMVASGYNQKVTPNSYINSFQIYVNADNFGVGTHIEFWGR